MKKSKSKKKVAVKTRKVAKVSKTVKRDFVRKKNEAIAKKRGPAVLEVVVAQRAQHKQWAAILRDNRKKDQHRAASNGIYKAFYDSLIFYFMRKIGSSYDSSDLQDLAMETMEKAFSKIKLYDPKHGALSTWVFKIALNCLVDRVRKDKKIDVVSVEAINAHNVSTMGEADAETFELSSHDFGPSDTTERSQTHSLVREAIAGLKNQSERRVVELRFLDEYSYEEIAEQLEMPMGTVKALIFRAKERLSETLSETLELQEA